MQPYYSVILRDTTNLDAFFCRTGNKFGLQLYRESAGGGPFQEFKHRPVTLIYQDTRRREITSYVGRRVHTWMRNLISVLSPAYAT